MDIKHHEGKNKGDVVLYALSTCVWCSKTKKLLNELGVEYRHIDVDLLESAERENVKQEIMRWNPRCSFPTLVINNGICIVGYDEARIKKELES